MIIPNLSMTVPVYPKSFSCFTSEGKTEVELSHLWKENKEGIKESWLAIIYFVTWLFGQVDGGFVDASLIGRAMGMSFCYREGKSFYHREGKRGRGWNGKSSIMVLWYVSAYGSAKVQTKKREEIEKMLSISGNYWLVKNSQLSCLFVS